MGDIPDELQSLLCVRPNLPAGCTECKYDPINGDWVPLSNLKKLDKATKERLEDVKVIVGQAKTSKRVFFCFYYCSLWSFLEWRVSCSCRKKQASLREADSVFLVASSNRSIKVSCMRRGHREEDVPRRVPNQSALA